MHVKFDKNQLVGAAPELITRPADVIVPWPGEPWRCNVVAKLDGPNDTPAEYQRYGSPPSTRWIGSVPYDPTLTLTPSWCWPPRV